MSEHETAADDLPAHRYDARLASAIEDRWQDRWEAEGTFHAPNPSGELADGFDAVAEGERLYVLDMFPYPSGAGLHVGHPLGFIGTDVFARYKRMTGHNVIHTMGFDSFGLPAEQFAVQTGQHPRTTTEQNIATYRRQLRRLGLGHDPRRSVATTDESFYRWTQWIFLQIFNSWYDTDAQRARPIEELRADFVSGARSPGGSTPWSDLTPSEQEDVIDDHRLAYLSEAMVNWCPGLGTVLANEEVTADGRSDRGNYPVYRKPLRQWMIRITTYADRLIDDLDRLDWPEPIKLMQRNWIGRSQGARVRFESQTAADASIEVFTTRPDTLFGATYMVLAPEHELVDQLAAAEWPAGTDPRWTGGAATPAEAISAYRLEASQKSDIQRQADAKDKTGVFLGVTATNPVNGAEIPVFIADYVLMGYGTGAIMAVPAEDERDWAFATQFGLPIIRTVQPPDDWEDGAWTGDGATINSDYLNGLDRETAIETIVGRLESDGTGEGTIQYRLRDWLFSRQRYWGEPFPIVFGEEGRPLAVPEDQLPITLPEIDDYAPRPKGEDDEPEPPLGRADWWATVELDLGDGLKTYRRELNTMPQWAGSCWYHLRYLDPTNEDVLVDPDTEKYWLSPKTDGATGGVDLYVGGVEHAVLHLLYARMWHKVLFDLGHVSSEEPFHKLFNQGYIQAAAYLDERGMHVEAAEVVEKDGAFFHDGEPVRREMGKMGKSLKNSVTPDEMCEKYGADSFRLYEMFTGPLDQSRPWETKDVVGVYRVLQRIWRVIIDEDTGTTRVTDAPADDDTRRALHRAIEAVTDGMETLRFNVSIAKITELTNHLTAAGPDAATAREVAEPLILLLAPLAPHMAEELWSRIGHDTSLARQPFPVADPAWLTTDQVEIVVQINGKVRARLQLSPDAGKDEMESAARADERIAELLGDQDIRKVIPVPGKLINFVV